MPAIIIITFNPAIDKSTTVAALIPEKKLKCTTSFYEPGGGGINVARAIKKLGGEAIAIYLAGGYTGKAFSELLTKESVASIVIGTAGSTRENLIVVQTVSNQQALKQAVNEAVYLIKPNLSKLSSLVGKEELNIELVDDEARTVIEKGKYEVVVVSMGHAGGTFVQVNTKNDAE